MVDSTNNYAKYLSKVEYPDIPKKPNQSNYDMNNPADIRRLADDQEKYNLNKQVYDAKLKVYRDSQNEGFNQFQHDLTIDEINDGIPKEVVDAVFSLAYANGHHAGFGEVENLYNEYIEPVKLYRNILRRQEQNN